MDYNNIKINADTEQEFIDLLKNTSPSDILSLFFNTQSQRAAIYTRFNKYVHTYITVVIFINVKIYLLQCNSGFKQFLVDNNEEEYQKLCTSVSTMISKISKEIIHIENSLKDIKPNWSAIINQLRELEKAKFLLTSQQQILKTEIHSNTSTKKDEEGNEYSMPTTGCYQEHIDQCNQQLTVCNQQLAQCINEINEKLEELQYELQDDESEVTTPTTSTSTCNHDHH
ncbi:hypothetical protein PPL_05846 [Heterostelium album PN500]|uniref:Uncharacterized protein n=1 Tax=Heterostelium pallidum (strain ATCC 26659 / Pp 5 / PN500) TaxID=670386 RepID=D3BBH8_HETP5|nr:hypothetical protein PPL_05846 [Heterostelium album PN500]EFA81011.1 hypothetical protein PPL_05846 [Heterostelium album PN500]|eukprot:XP_020433129.1 hypothetical protein PPL_05846 [Heterostelium album PN500]